MSAKRQIVVKIDARKGKSSSNQKREYKETTQPIEQEVAATVEKSRDDDIHTFAREYEPSLVHTKAGKKPNSKLTMFKPILFAILSAIIVGSIMGFIMLRIIVNFDNDVNATPAFVPSVDNEKTEDKADTEGKSESTTSSYTLGAMSAFVLQGGVFSEQSNAENESQKFIDAGFSPVVWEKDGQFYLLVSVGSSKEVLNQDLETLANKGIEVYGKEWQIGEADVRLSKAEYDWLLTFQEKWQSSIENNQLDVSSWQDVLKKAKGDSEQFNSFVSDLGGIVQQNDTNALLDMWKTYQLFVTSTIE